MSHWSDVEEPPSQITTSADAIAELDREIKKISDEKKRRSLNKIESLFPDEGPFRRDLYSKHLEFFRAGRYYRCRLFSAGNRVGKTTAGGFEMACHLTGNYPPFWPGRKFDSAIRAWACGTTNETTKNVVQAELLGHLEKDDNVSDGLIGMGTGMIPLSLIAGFEAHAQIRGAMKTVWVRHKSGGRSVLAFHSYEQGREAFEGTAQHVIWGDEEIPLDIYTECIMRLMTTDGIFYSTSTPLRGLTDIVMQFMPDGIVPEWQTCKACGKQLMAIDHTCAI